MFDQFVIGDFEFGGHADAAAKSGEIGAAAAGELYVEDDIRNISDDRGMNCASGDRGRDIFPRLRRI